MLSLLLSTAHLAGYAAKLCTLVKCLPPFTFEHTSIVDMHLIGPTQNHYDSTNTLRKKSREAQARHGTPQQWLGVQNRTEMAEVAANQQQLDANFRHAQAELAGQQAEEVQVLLQQLRLEEVVEAERQQAEERQHQEDGTQQGQRSEAEQQTTPTAQPRGNLMRLRKKLE